jgi:folate-binding protein YgfZ
MCWIEVDESELDAVLRHLKRHKLRSKLAIQEAKGTVYAGWDFSKDAVACFSKLESGGVLFMEDPRAEGAGLVRLFDPHTQRENGPVAPKISELLDNAVGAINFTNAEDYRLQRYLLGIPEGPTEIPRESALPMEANFDLNQAIDFKKGCYVGQELTIRTKHTGVVRKRILPVQIYRLGEHIRDGQEGAVFDPAWTLGAVENNPEKGVAHSLIGADIKQLDEEGEIKKGRSAGKFIAGIGNVGLALCRLEMMTDMRVSAEGGSWRPGMEFGIRVGGDADGEQPNNGKGEVLRVKPFVFDWFKERERALWEKGRGKARA